MLPLISATKSRAIAASLPAAGFLPKCASGKNVVDHVKTAHPD
jgi:hypothetical protein